MLQDERQVKDWHRLYDDILRCRRALLRDGVVKYPAQEEVGFLRSAFYRSVCLSVCVPAAPLRLIVVLSLHDWRRGVVVSGVRQ